MKIRRTVFTMSVLALAMIAQPTLAGPSKISAVFTDTPSSGYLTINGSDFYKPVVSLDGYGSLTVQAGWTATQIVVACPSAPCPKGDFLLTVSKEKEGKDKDTWDLTIGAVGPAGADAPVAYGVGTVNVKRGPAGAPAIWAAYSTRLGSPLGADLVSPQAAVLGDTASGTFRFTCRDTHVVCEVAVAAATLATVAGQTVYVYPRVLIQKQDYNFGGPQIYCEYGDGSTGAAPTLVPTQVSTSTPVYTPMMINIGGTADCSGPVSTAGDVAVITVGPGYYDVFSTFVFKKP
jgi:hypothetical protein